MKNFISTIALLSLVFSSFYIPIGNNVAKAATLPEPEGHWMLDEGSGTTATDSSGNGHDGTFAQGAPTWTAGKFGGGINARINITQSRYATVPYTFDWNDDFTLSAWFSASTFPLENTVLMGFGTGPNPRFRIGMGEDFVVLDTCTTGEVYESYSIADSSWHHIAATKDADEIRLYVDGVLIGSSPWSNPINCAGSSLYLGGFNSNTSIDGIADDFRLYTTALTERQVQLLALECDIEDRECESHDVPITASVPGDLTFNISSNLCNLGSLSVSSASSCTHTMSASTNATNGYVINYLPTSTLTSANLDEIDSTGATGSVSNVGTKQFGFNLVSNSSPAVGANPSGGIGAALADYNTTNIFSFNTSGATVAGSTGPSENTAYTASYIANIDGNTPQGEYSTVVTYVITASY